MDFDEAGAVAAPFGKYFLWPLSRILAEQPGYLNFLLGLLAKGRVKSPRFAEALTVYRDHPEVVKALDKAKAKKKANAARAHSRRYASRKWGEYFNK